MTFFLRLARNLGVFLVVVVGSGVSLAFAHPAGHVTDLATQGGIAAAPQAPIIDMAWGHEDAWSTWLAPKSSRRLSCSSLFSSPSRSEASMPSLRARQDDRRGLSGR